MEEDPVEELERTFIFDPIGFGYINMSHGMLVEISEELRAKFPKFMIFDKNYFTYYRDFTLRNTPAVMYQEKAVF